MTIQNIEGFKRLTQEGGATLSYTDVPLIEQDGLWFKDLARTGELLPYEDWRLDAWTRAKDLAARLSIGQIAGLMLYSPHQMVPPMPFGPFPGTFGGKKFEESGAEPSALSDQQKHFIGDENIRHILLTRVKDARTSAAWNNNLQKEAEALPFGIPVNICSDPRSGARGSGAEFKNEGGDVSKWPEGLGFAACFDPSVVKRFAEDASREYRALGIATALGPQIDLCTEPRWMRLVDTLGEHTPTSIALTKAYCDGMQTTEGAPDGWGRDSVNTMVKHWPGGGTGEGGRDAHYPFGKYNVYPAGNFAEHLKPFTEGAFKLDGPTKCASAVMPYYSISYGQTDEETGNSYNAQIVRDMLRGEYGFEGVVCTDWGITGDPSPEFDSFSQRSYGVEHLSVAERHLRCILNGVDQFGGNSASAPILEAYRIGCEQYGEQSMRERYELAAARILRNAIRCGLFEDAYLDPEASAKIVGCEAFARDGYEAQRRSVVLLKNKNAVLPLKKGIRVYIPEREIRPSKGFFRQPVPGQHIDPVSTDVLAPYARRVATPEEADAALVFIESPACDCYDNGYKPISLQYRPYTAVKAREKSIAGDRSYYGETSICCNERDLDNILETRARMDGKPVIVLAAVNNPMVMSEFEPCADAIAAEFGVSRQALLDIVFGEAAPSGRLPIQMPKDMETVETHCEDKPFDLIPYTDSEGNAYDYGFGLKY